MSDRLPNFIRDIRECDDCLLHTTRKAGRRPLIGAGSYPADILFLGGTITEVQETTGKILQSFDSKYIHNLVERAAIKVAVEEPDIFISNMVFCRATDEKAGSTRPPKSKEIISCSKHFARLMEFVKPKYVFFFTKEVERHYKNEFKDYGNLLRPSYIIRSGGNSSPDFPTQLQKVCEVLEWLKKR
ncbi:hypothetical protein DRH27_00080 [Candidatus Falkowbacteria bacterium]|nr:MAG: hypothetical protein DRH27_00080 [Candidatus Falkowbacteria bacterium]